MAPTASAEERTHGRTRDVTGPVRSLRCGSSVASFVRGYAGDACRHPAGSDVFVSTRSFSKRWKSMKRLVLVLLVIGPMCSAAGAAITVDATTSVDRSPASTTVTSQAFPTHAAPTLLLAFVSADYLSGANTTVTALSGGGLTWSLVVRSNAQSGTAEIWRAFATSPLTNATVTATLSQSVVSSLTVVAFDGVDTSGTNGSGAIGATQAASAPSGAPTATVTTTRDGSWVFGVGEDYDNAIARTPGAGQSPVHQDLSPTGDTYWVQMQNAPTPARGTNVTLNDTAPTGDRYNLSVCEILPATVTTGSSLSGSISPPSAGSGASLTLTSNGTQIASAFADASGNYNFSGLANGTYIVTPSKSGFTFSPPTQSVTINGASTSGINFTATATQTTTSISGSIAPAGSGIGTLVTLSGATIATITTTADAAGNYSFASLTAGTYTVTPTKSSFTFAPASQSVVVPGPGGCSGTQVAGVNFTATPIPTWTISGTISPAALGSGTLVTLSGSANATATADGSGNFSFSGRQNGTCTVTPSKTGDTFSPTSQTVSINGASRSGVNFAVQSGQPPALEYPDLSDIIPADKMSIAGTGSNRVFQYTHDTFNGGPGPLVIQPAYHPDSGVYQGTQYIYSLSSSGTWTLANTIPIAGAFVFDAAHGHFHFPFTSYGLYTVGPNGGPGTVVASSAKVSFCINDSFIFDPSLPNAGALGNLGSCTDPTSLRGLDIGAVDEYDQTDEGQAISIAGLPDGTYWLRAVVDPNDFFAEADKSNNETDVELTISGNTVHVLQTVVPTLPPPPGITVTSPADGASVSGSVQLTVNTATSSGVQYLIDGHPLVSLITTAPYSFSWDSTTATNGVHWLAAQTTGATGRIGTSPVVSVTVSNSSSAPPTVTLTSPDAGSTVSASVVVSATVASSQTIASVAVFVDNVQVGTTLTAPPYIVFWDTETATAGQHVITATAMDVTGNTGSSVPTTVTVDNSHPPNTIAEEKVVSVDGQGVMQTPMF